MRFETFSKIHPFWYPRASLTSFSTVPVFGPALIILTSAKCQFVLFLGPVGGHFNFKSFSFSNLKLLVEVRTLS